MAPIPRRIEARVIQKIATVQEWETEPLVTVPYEGEIMLVSDSLGKVINIKVGDGVRAFPDLEFMFDTIQQNVNFIEYQSNPNVDIGFSVVGEGSYSSVTVAKGDWAVLYWDGSNWSRMGNWDMPNKFPVNSLNSTSTTDGLSANQGRVLKTIVDTKLDSSNVVDNLNTSASGLPLSAKQGVELNNKIAGFAGQIGTGIVGEAKPNTVPISEGFSIYTSSTTGEYINFKDSANNPIIVSESDLTAGTGGLVQLWGNSNVWEKHVTVIDDNYKNPVFSDNLSDI